MPAATHIYLHFDGDCREAMNFYAACLRGEPDFTPFSAGPPEMREACEAAPDRILHAEVGTDFGVLMAADVRPGEPFTKGNNFSVSISCASHAEADRVFAALSDGGVVTMPLHDAFWGGRFGMLTDKFGIGWMVSFRA